MPRFFALALALALALPLAASAQDVPLSTFLVEGTTWTAAAGSRPPALDPELIPDRVLADGRAYVVIPKMGQIAYGLGLIPASPNGRVQPVPVPAPDQPTAVTLSPDKTTLYVGGADGAHLWAYRVEADGSLSGGEPYAPLRFRRGAKEPKVPVAGLTADTAGRIYALTPTGVNVFDPTGRPAGVLAVPGPGKPEFIGWEGEKRDVLVVWVGGKKFTRPMRAAGVK